MVSLIIIIIVAVLISVILAVVFPRNIELEYELWELQNKRLCRDRKKGK
jgi:hypothetical protein